MDIEKIKKLTLIAMFSDEDLMDLLVLKGGNAIDLIYEIDSRSSIDLDFSMNSSFEDLGLSGVNKRIERIISSTFAEENITAFDFKFKDKPPQITPDMKDFWGGYSVEFKVIESDKFDLSNIDKSRKTAIAAGINGRKALKIDISKHEYCQTKEKRTMDGYTIYVYSPAMIVFEKLRAVCQQTPEYKKIVKSPSSSARARDFYDIYVILRRFNLDLKSQENLKLLKNIFQAKKVPIKLLLSISNNRDFHSPDFQSVIDTLKPFVEIQDFDFYFDYVIDLINNLEILWEK